MFGWWDGGGWSRSILISVAFGSCTSRAEPSRDRNIPYRFCTAPLVHFGRTQRLWRVSLLPRSPISVQSPLPTLFSPLHLLVSIYVPLACFSRTWHPSSRAWHPSSRALVNSPEERSGWLEICSHSCSPTEQGTEWLRPSNQTQNGMALSLQPNNYWSHSTPKT